MKTTRSNVTENGELSLTLGGKFARACSDSSRRLLAQIENTKNAIFAEFLAAREAGDQLLRLALNEAEAVAWQTDFPHLVFPALAREKAEAAIAWQRRQDSILGTHEVLSFAA